VELYPATPIRWTIFLSLGSGEEDVETAFCLIFFFFLVRARFSASTEQH
jgi:hypothetical protein